MGSLENWKLQNVKMSFKCWSDMMEHLKLLPDNCDFLGGCLIKEC